MGDYKIRSCGMWGLVGEAFRKAPSVLISLGIVADCRCLLYLLGRLQSDVYS
jgi:hypothetical protein